LDTDGDGILDFEDDDDDGDSLLTSSEHGGYGFTPEEAGGKSFHLNPDDDFDGVFTIVEVGADPNNPRDTDVDGTPDYLDVDDDGDGILTSAETGGLPTDGLLNHRSGSCEFGGTESSSGSCAAAPEVL